MIARTRWIVAVALVTVLGASLFLPAGAHLKGGVKHVWNEHIKAKTKKLAYTKKKADRRFLPHSNLPPGKSIEGIWAVTELDNYAGWHSETLPQRLPAAVAVNYILPDGTNLADQPASNCPGTVKRPEALRGHLCVYEGASENLADHVPDVSARFCFFRSDQLNNFCDATSSRAGFTVAVFPSIPGEHFYATGTWALTAGSTTPPVEQLPQTARRALSGHRG